MNKFNENVITFTKIDLPYGWLGNMSRHSLNHDGKEWKTCEHLFQALRFDDGNIREEIRINKSPMGAKMVSKKYKNELKIKHFTAEVLELMKFIINLKFSQHSDIREKCKEISGKFIIEDVSNRNTERNRFWGMFLDKSRNLWIGENHLGNIWMETINSNLGTK